MTKRLVSGVSSSNNWSALAKDWTRDVMEVKSISNSIAVPANELQITMAIERALPLLQDSNSVPFVCRYRSDMTSPLSVPQVHFLSQQLQKYKSLATLRNKLLDLAPTQLHRKILTSTSKSELEDFYAPYRPPSKGSLAERIQKEHPKLVVMIEGVWSGEKHIAAHNLNPRNDAIHLLASRISSDPRVIDQLTERMQQNCRIKIVELEDNQQKYKNYYNLNCTVHSLRDHQVLAISRGVTQKALKLSFDMDADKMHSMLRMVLMKQIFPLALVKDCRVNDDYKSLLQDSIKDSWSRLLRRKLITRVWSTKLKSAQLRAIQLFQDNLKNALLAPPMVPPEPILALDPGFQAGIKCAVLDSSGQVLKNSVAAVRFLGREHDEAIAKLIGLLKATLLLSNQSKVTVAIGNGHGTYECQQLIQQASETANISIEIRLVDEAGASVWSVTDIAALEFPLYKPSEVAAISIGRRLQNPLQELVKVPPRSLGLGMYQHDLSEKLLDEHLHLACVDAVAAVGVDVNTCSLEILKKVPGLSTLASEVIKARPIKSRKELLEIMGLGPMTFENCAAFVRCTGEEVLDSTLVHPESYELARWLVKRLGWNLVSPPKTLPSRDDREALWLHHINAASKEFGISSERIVSVIDHLVDSMTNPDPRIKEGTSQSEVTMTGFHALSPELASNSDALRKACPVRGIIGTIRNIVDFGVFIDFGGHSDGLLHRSNLGSRSMDSLLIGQELGIDVLKVEGQKVSIAIASLGCDPEGKQQVVSAEKKLVTQKPPFPSTMEVPVPQKLPFTKEDPVSRKRPFTKEEPVSQKRPSTTKEDSASQKRPSIKKPESQKRRPIKKDPVSKKSRFPSTKEESVFQE